jgi:hypothetical protein
MPDVGAAETIDHTQAMYNLQFLAHKNHYTHTHILICFVYEKNWIEKKIKNWMNDKEQLWMRLREEDRNWDKEK